MAATVSGTVLSTIFFDNSNCISDQEGFLLGQVVSHITDEISDSQIGSVKEETSVQIHGHLPCSSLLSFYDNRGRIQHEKLEAVLKDKCRNLIGWYKFRHNSSMVVSMRERVIHQGLIDTVNATVKQHFIFCLCVGTVNSNVSTLSFDHTFLRFNGRDFQPISVSVVNLGSTSPSEYKVKPSTTVSHMNSLYGAVLTQYQRESGGGDSDYQSKEACDVLTINNMLQQKLSELCIGVVSSEQQLADLEAELRDIRQRWKNCKQLEDNKESMTSVQGTHGFEHSRSLEPLGTSPPPRPPKNKAMSLERGRDLKTSLPDAEESLILDLEEPPHRLVPKSPAQQIKDLKLDDVVKTSASHTAGAASFKSTNPFAVDLLDESLSRKSSKKTNSNPFLSSETNGTESSSVQNVSNNSKVADSVKVTRTGQSKESEDTPKRDLLDSVELWDAEVNLPPPLLSDEKEESGKASKVKTAGKSQQSNKLGSSSDTNSDVEKTEKAGGKISSPFSFIDDVLQKAQSPLKEQQQLQKQYKYSTLPRPSAKVAESKSPSNQRKSVQNVKGDSESRAKETMTRMTRARASRNAQNNNQAECAKTEVKGQMPKSKPVTQQSKEVSNSLDKGGDLSSSPTF